MLGQDLAIGGAGELAAAVGVDDEGSAGLTWRKAMRKAAIVVGIPESALMAHRLPAGCRGPRLRPDRASPRRSGHRSHRWPRLRWDDLLLSLETVGCNRSAVTAVGGGVPILGALPGKEVFLTHEPGDAIAPSWTTKHTGQARTAIGLTTARKLLADASAQRAALALPRPGLLAPLLPVVIAAARDEQRFA